MSYKSSKTKKSKPKISAELSEISEKLCNTFCICYNSVDFHNPYDFIILSSFKRQFIEHIYKNYITHNLKFSIVIFKKCVVRNFVNNLTKMTKFFQL